jgi:hypothetical protein
VFAKIRGRDLLHLQQRFTLGRGVARAIARTHLRNGDAEALRQLPDRVLEADLLFELDELEDVAAHLAAETEEQAPVAIDVERGRLLGVERTEALVAGPRLPQDT